MRLLHDGYEDENIEVYDNFSFKCFLKNEELEPQHDFQNAYDILNEEIEDFELIYAGSADSWTDIYISKSGNKYAIYGDGSITACIKFTVLRLS